MEQKQFTVDLNRYLVGPKCKTVDHVRQLDFLKRTGRPKVELVDLNNSCNLHLVDLKPLIVGYEW